MKFHKLFIFMVFLVISAALTGCTRDVTAYTKKRHLKNCVEIIDQEELHPRLRIKHINNCMKARGHKNFSFVDYVEEKGADSTTF